MDSNEDSLGLTNAPNLLTSVRIALVPVMVAMLFFQTHEWDIAAALVFTFASITDYFDGYLARRNSQITVFGKLMDPLADKFLVVSALIMLQHLDRVHPVVVMLLVCREFAITGLRAVASTEGLVIAASSGGKWKTATQMTAIPLMMVAPGFWGLPLFKIGNALLYISLGISLWSARDYIWGFFRALREKRKIKRELRRQKKRS